MFNIVVSNLNILYLNKNCSTYINILKYNVLKTTQQICLDYQWLILLTGLGLTT